MNANSKNNQRNELKNDLMDFSKVFNRINDVLPYFENYQIGRTTKDKKNNSFEVNYSFINFCRSHVLVFNTRYLDKKHFSESMMFDLLCAINDLPTEDFTQKERIGKDWKSIESVGFTSLVQKFEQFKKEEAARIEAQKEAARIEAEKAEKAAAKEAEKAAKEAAKKAAVNVSEVANQSKRGSRKRIAA